MTLSRFLRRSLASLALLTPFAHAATPVTLVVGDQNYYNVRASVEASGALKDAPYSVEWKHFQSAAPVAEGLEAGALDLGFLGDSGFIFLAAKGAPVKLIGVSRQNPDTIALLVPKDSPAKTIQDLKGKKVAYWPGAWSQQLTLRALENAGLPKDYVEFVKLMPIDAAAALPQGSSRCLPGVGTLHLAAAGILRCTSDHHGTRPDAGLVEHRCECQLHRTEARGHRRFPRSPAESPGLGTGQQGNLR